MKFSDFARPYDEYDWWNDLCPGGHWKRVSPTVFEGILPDGLLVKSNAAVVMSSDSGNATAFVTNLFRVEPDVGEIDQEPYILTFNHDHSESSGYFIHHGSWDGRTVSPGSTFFDAVESSGIEHHYPYRVIPPGSSGLMSDLKLHPEAEGFCKDMKVIRSDKKK